MSAELPSWIADPALCPAWSLIRRRFEAQGLVPQGRVRLPTASRQERHAIGGLVGRTLTRDSVIVDLAALDERLRQRSGVGGLAAVLDRLFPDDLRDRPAQRAARLAARERPLELAAELVDRPWTADWIAGMRSTGLLTGRGEGERVVRQAAAILAVLCPVAGGVTGRVPSEFPSDTYDPSTSLVPTEAPAARHASRKAEGLAAAALPDRRPNGGARAISSGPAVQTWSRVELGARLAGDAHALDRDRLLHHVVLRALAAASGIPVPEGAQSRESLWARFGVEADLLSRTCLVWGWEPAGHSSVERRLAEASRAGDPIHLTAWDLRETEPHAFAASRRVLVCENPRVVEAIAEASVQGWTVVCTAGEPNLVAGAVLAGLASAGAELRYHGDFDWPGLAIANRVVARFGAIPILMSADDYLAAVRSDGPSLVGAAVEASWDPDLAAAMDLHGRAVHEESVLDTLLVEIRRCVSEDPDPALTGRAGHEGEGMRESLVEDEGLTE